MKDQERGKFEDAWQNAFDQAQLTPSEKIWEGVERGLDKNLTVRMKTRVIFYQRLAAASIIVAFLLGGLSTYYIVDIRNHQEGDKIAQGDIKSSDESVAPESDNQKAPNQTQLPVDSLGLFTSTYSTQETKHSISPRNKLASVNTESSSEESDIDSKSIFNHPIYSYNSEGETKNQFKDLFQEPIAKLSGEIRKVELVRKLPAMPAELMNTSKDSKSTEKLWAAVGASSGNYSPTANLTSSSSRALYQNSGGLSNGQVASSTSSSKGTAFSAGMNVGKRISRRWLMQGGISYLNQSIGYTSNYAVVGANNKIMASVADYSNLNSYGDVISVSTPYEINSVNEFVSLPLQAGYIILDNKLGLQLNSGISTDFFIRNTLTDRSGQMSSFSSSAGVDSPYRSISWAGLMSTELSYKIATQYRVSVAPGLRYSINSVFKSNIAASNPLVWDIGFRFRYIFN